MKKIIEFITRLFSGKKKPPTTPTVKYRYRVKVAKKDGTITYTKVV